MMNPIVYALAETPMKDTVGETFGERAGVAGSVTLLGMVTIFAVLAILWGVIEVLHRVLNRGGKTDTPAAKPAAPVAKPAAEAKKPAQATQATQATQTVKATETARRDDGELVAVITAAVAAAMEEEGYTGGFRVVSFRRTQNRKSGR